MAKKAKKARKPKRTGARVSRAWKGVQEDDQGKGVKDLQDYLARYGYLTLPAAAIGGALVGIGGGGVFGALTTTATLIHQYGVFDRSTVKALTRFQRLHGLPVTGWLDPETRAFMNLARCSLPDPRAPEPNVAIEQDRSWFPSEGKSLAYFVAPTPGGAAVDSQVFRGAIEAALEVWKAVVDFAFTQVNSAADAVLRMSIKGLAHHGCQSFQAQELAHAYLPGSGPLSGDVHFNVTKNWTTDLEQAKKPTFVDLVTVAAHEIGHALGLHHSPDRDALMYPVYLRRHRFTIEEEEQRIKSAYP